MAPPIEIIIDVDDRVSGKFRNTSTEAKKMAAIIGGAFSRVANSADVALAGTGLEAFTGEVARTMLAPFYGDTMQETVDKHTSGGKVLDVTVKSIIELEYKREAFKPYNKIKRLTEREETNMNKYIKVAVAYKFKPEGEVYKQAHYREVTPEEHFNTVKIDTFHMFSNLFDKLVYLEGVNVTEVSELEYRGGRAEEEAELRFLQQITLDGCVS